MAATREDVAAADNEDVRICGVFVVAIVTGTAWFYWDVLCCAVRLAQ